MLQVKDLDVNIGPTPILRDVSLTLPSGKMCGLIGRNGAGKTTFLRSIMGLLPTASGSIKFDDTDLVAEPDYRRAHLGVGYMPEDRRLVPTLTVQENVLLPVWSTKADGSEKRLDWIYNLIPEVSEFRARKASALSGGQQKLVALARALMVGHEILLLDEPTEGIAPVLAKRMLDVLEDLKNEGLCVLIAESNDQHIQGLLDSLYIIERGSVHEATTS